MSDCTCSTDKPDEVRIDPETGWAWAKESEEGQVTVTNGARSRTVTLATWITWDRA